ncbi:MAG: glycosyltransferase family 39 protein [Anaerolineae bacterium]|nr:glycosyltransferase family 39 protein [Anaerolineae bacterium]
MDERNRRIALLFLLSGLALVVLGQAYFALWERYVWDGVIFYVLGALCWVAALGCLEGRVRRLPRPFRALQLVFDHPRRAALLGASILLCLGVGLAAARATQERSFWPHLTCWLCGLLCFLLSLAPPLPGDALRRLQAWSGRRQWELLGVVLLLAAALAARAVALERVPGNFGGDEGTQALAAFELLEPPLGNPFSTGWYSVPTMSFFAYGLVMRLLGATVAGARFLSALAGVVTVLFVFLVARELAGRWVGWAAGLLVAFSHYAIHFSRLASNQVADGFFTAAALFCLLQALEKKRPASRLWFGLAGVVLGLSWYAYFGARLALVVVAGYLVWRALAEPRFLARNAPGLAFLAVGALLAAAPLFFHYLKCPESLLSRYNQVSIFASGWLEMAVQATGRSRLALLLEQFWKSISAYNVTPDPTFWYYPGVPYLDPVSGVFFVLGLTTAVRRLRRPAAGLLLLWFLAFVILGWALTENPPSSQRGVGGLSVVVILAAWGMVEMAAHVSRLLIRRDDAPSPPQAGWPYEALVVALLLVVVIVANLVFYFGVYTPQRVYGNPNAEVADVLCDSLERRPQLPPVYFDGAPALYWDFGALAFRLRDASGQDFAPADGLDAVDLSQGALFVVLGDRIADLDLIQAAVPGGTAELYHSQVDDRLLFALYEIPPRRSQ